LSVSRYRNDTPIRGGKIKRTAVAVLKIRHAVQRGDIRTSIVTLKEGERLDQLAAKYYGDGRYWWILAAASNIGWWMQVPPETVIRVPIDLPSVMEHV